MLPPGLARLFGQSLGNEVASDGDDRDRTGRTLRRVGSRFTESDNDGRFFFYERLRHLGKSLGVAVGKAEVEAQASALDIP